MSNIDIDEFMQKYKDDYTTLMATVDRLANEHRETLKKVLSAIEEDSSLSADDTATLLNWVIFSLFWNTRT